MLLTGKEQFDFHADSNDLYFNIDIYPLAL